MNKPSCIEYDVALAPRTTLGVGGSAEYYAVAQDVEMAQEVLLWARAEGVPVTIFGGGSNILVPDSGVKGLVLRVAIQGVLYEECNDGTVRVTAGAGVLLDELIEELVQKNLWGLENLTSIPGTVGAVPIQNVGAYGVEGKDVIVGVTVYDYEKDAFSVLTNEACQFAYRDSVFKHHEGEKYLVTDVTFTVSPTPMPKLAYKDLRERFGTDVPTVREVRSAVQEIRSKKFPDWHVLGTAGSFFKNPIVTKEVSARLQATYPDLPVYTQEDGTVKLSLGWILDHVCNLKGYWKGNVGLYEAQALVLVCKKGAASDDVKNFSDEVIERVLEKTGVRVDREVVLL